MLIDNLKLKVDRDGDGNFTDAGEVVHPDDFALNSGYAEETLTYDAAGNLTYDGQHRYGYDAWNRLVKVSKDNRHADSDPVIATLGYDGLGRRISKAIANFGDFDGTCHYCYDGQKCIEIRNGLSAVLKQHGYGRSDC